MKPVQLLQTHTVNGDNNMFYDDLTYSAITVAVIVIIVVVLMTRSQARLDRKLRRFARQMSMMMSNEEARELCRKIHSSHPDLCPGLDYTLKESGNKIKIDEWNSDKPKPDQ
jgi:hypothetical protein